MKSAALVLSILTLALGGCNDGQDLFEDVGKLRAIGCASSPVIGQPSTTTSPQIVTLTAYAALPVGQRVDSVESFLDGQSAFAPPANAQLVANSEVYDDHKMLSIYSVKATVAIPALADLVFDQTAGFAVLRYGLQLNSAGEKQLLVGNVIVYPAGSPQLAWTAPTAAITEPADGGAVSGTQPLKAAVASTDGGEQVRVGWYVNGGAVDNRQGATTTWKVPATGPNTIILTARGFTSGGFALQAIDVVGQ